MKVWVVDEDSRCPCGHVFGLAAKDGDMKLRRENLVEMHADIVGPCKKDFVVAYTNYRRACKNNDRLIGAFMYKRTDSEQGIDIETWKPKIANRTGGLSGPAVKPVAIRMVYDVYKAVKIPIIGMGGICDGADAVEFLLAGASAVAVGTANFVDPYTPLKVIDYLTEYMERHNISKVSDLVGAVKC